MSNKFFVSLSRTQKATRMTRGGGGGCFREFLVEVCRPISDQKTSFFTRVFRPDLEEIMSSLLRLEGNNKDFLKSISNSHVSLSFLLIWN